MWKFLAEAIVGFLVPMLGDPSWENRKTAYLVLEAAHNYGDLREQLAALPPQEDVEIQYRLDKIKASYFDVWPADDLVSQIRIDQLPPSIRCWAHGALITSIDAEAIRLSNISGDCYIYLTPAYREASRPYIRMCLEKRIFTRWQVMAALGQVVKKNRERGYVYEVDPFMRRYTQGDPWQKLGASP